MKTPSVSSFYLLENSYGARARRTNVQAAGQSRGYGKTSFLVSYLYKTNALTGYWAVLWQVPVVPKRAMTFSVDIFCPSRRAQSVTRDPDPEKTELRAPRPPFELEIVFLGVMTEGTVTDFEKFGSASTNSARLGQSGLQIQSFSIGDFLFKIESFGWKNRQRSP